MPQISTKILTLPRSRLFALSAALLALGVAACTEDDKDPSCVSAGMGWNLCAAKMMSTNPAVGENTGGGGAGESAGSDSSAGSGGKPTMSEAGTGGEDERGTGSAGIGGATAGAGGEGERGTGSAGVGGATAGATGAGGKVAAGSGGAGSGATSGAGGAGAAAAGMTGVSGYGGSAAGSSGAAGAGSGGAGTGVSGTAAPGMPGCCHELGRCVADADLTEHQRAFLGKETCEDAAALCAPNALLSNSQFIPKTCVSVLQAEGRCLPDCMSNLAQQTRRLPRDICSEHELCTPCFDPVSGDATGACELGGDPGPRRLPRVFSGCCGSLGDARGLCVPQGYVPTGVTMPRESCLDAEMFCVPREWLGDPTSKPMECSADIRGPGKCVPQCIADQFGALLTTQASCKAGDQCYPCGIVGGIATGLCAPEP